MHTALIIIDMLHDFIDPAGALYCGQTTEAIVPRIGRRLEACRRAGDCVIYLQDSHTADDKEFQKFPPHCISGTWGNQIIPSLASQPLEKVIAKARYCGFYGTNLEITLFAIRPQLVQVVGVCTSICVMDTVGGLVNRDYAVQVPVAEVADFDPQAHAFALQRMQKIYGIELI